MSVRRQEPMLRPLAMAAERANRPTAIVVFSGALLAASLVFLFWSAKGVNAAEARLRRATNEAIEVQRVAAEITRMRDAGTQSTGEEAKYRPIPTLLSSISASADQAGLSTRPQITPQRDDTQLDGALVRKNIGARVSGQEIGDVLRWVETVLRQVDGLYVSQFKVTPNRTTGWNIELRFSRWELKQ
jgi:type II secretory pathway component PulM